MFAALSIPTKISQRAVPEIKSSLPTPVPTPKVKTNTPEYITEKFYIDYLSCLRKEDADCNYREFNQVATTAAVLKSKSPQINPVTCSINIPQSIELTRVVGTTLTKALVYLDERFADSNLINSLVVETSKIDNQWKITNIICTT
jgi:hypothetical protein